MVEALHKVLAKVLVDECVVCDLVAPSLKLLRGWKVTEDQQVGNLEIARMLGQLFNRVSAVTQDAVLAIEFGDCRGCPRGGAKGGVLEPDSWQQLAPLFGVNSAVEDWDLYCFTSAIIGDGDCLGHVCSPEVYSSCILEPLWRVP